MTASGNELEWIGSIAPLQRFNIPFKAVYSPTAELFFSVEKHSITTEPFVWRDLQQNLILEKTLKCNTTQLESNHIFNIKV